MPGKLAAAAVVLLALVWACSALADGGPSPGLTEGGAGVLGGAVRYVTVQGGTTTQLEAVEVGNGVVRNWVTLRGVWGIPTVTYDGTTGGLSRDGSTLVLQASPYTCTRSGCGLTRSRFAVYTPALRRRATVVLHGTFSFDALSPDGHRLYLIQYLPSPNLSEYKVRAYDLTRRHLLPRAVADRTQRGWVMQGAPMTRVTSPDGRFAYTLYENQGGYPFVHALDSVRGVAHCVGLPLRNQAVLGRMRMTLRDGGRTLALDVAPGRGSGSSPSLAIDTQTWAVSQPAPHTGFPWWVLGPTAALLLLATGAVAARRRGTARQLAANA